MHRNTAARAVRRLAHFMPFLLLPLSWPALAEPFDVMGFKTGMPIDDFEQRAQEIAGNSVDINKVGIPSPIDGTIVDGTVYVAGYSFRSDNNLLEASATSKPMDPVIYEIKRVVNYTASCGRGAMQLQRCQELGPEYAVFERTLIEKYGKPVWQQLGGGRKGKEVQLLFADGNLSNACRDIVLPKVAHGNYRQLRWSVPDNYDTSAEVKKTLDNCPAFLHVRMEYLNRVDQPTLDAMFIMKDVSLEAEYETSYDPYWTKWMDENFERPKNTERPEL